MVKDSPGRNIFPDRQDSTVTDEKTFGGGVKDHLIQNDPRTVLQDPSILFFNDLNKTALCIDPAEVFFQFFSYIQGPCYIQFLQALFLLAQRNGETQTAHFSPLKLSDLCRER